MRAFSRAPVTPVRVMGGFAYRNNRLYHLGYTCWESAIYIFMNFYDDEEDAVVLSSFHESTVPIRTYTKTICTKYQISIRKRNSRGSFDRSLFDPSVFAITNRLPSDAKLLAI